MIELPPLPKMQPVLMDDMELGIIPDEFRHYRFVSEARERILQARIAELEADAERYRWLRTATYLGGETLAVFVIDEASEIANKGEWLSDEQLDAAIDAARKA